MEKFTGENVLKYHRSFDTVEKCESYLANLKWPNGFRCPICNHDQYYEGRRAHTKVCKKCRRIDSVTANTMFHKVKFGLHKAFWIVFAMSASTKGLSSTEVGRRLGITQKTAWLFMHKVRAAMKSSGTMPMRGKVHIDEFVVGGKEAGRPGRSSGGRKKKVACAIEMTDKNKVKRFYAKQIEDYSSDELTVLFDTHIAKDSKVSTDQWSAYKVIAGQYDVEQIPSKGGRNFPKMHIIISSLKSWLRAIPTQVSKKHIQAYLDEFAYRINRSIFKSTIFHKTIQRMAMGIPITWKNIVNT